MVYVANYTIRPSDGKLYHKGQEVELSYDEGQKYLEHGGVKRKPEQELAAAAEQPPVFEDKPKLPEPPKGKPTE